MKAGQDKSSDSGFLAGIKKAILVAGAAAVLVLPPVGWATAPFTLGSAAGRIADRSPAKAAPRYASFASHVPSSDARHVADWVTDSQDNQQLPFLILDKREARVFVFDPSGRVVDSSPVLLGAAVGDDTVPGIGDRPISEVRPEERTTPAGRFLTEPGRNMSGEDVIWIDYDAAVSMHRVRVTNPYERRLERLASPHPSERRISYGCVNVPVAFYEGVLRPLLGSTRGVVYVLPETREPRQVFANLYTLDRKQALNRTPIAGM